MPVCRWGRTVAAALKPRADDDPCRKGRAFPAELLYASCTAPASASLQLVQSTGKTGENAQYMFCLCTCHAKYRFATCWHILQVCFLFIALALRTVPPLLYITAKGMPSVPGCEQHSFERRGKMACVHVALHVLTCHTIHVCCCCCCLYGCLRCNQHFFIAHKHVLFFFFSCSHG